MILSAPAKQMTEVFNMLILSTPPQTGVGVLDTIIEFCVNYGLKLAGALLVLLIGIWMVKFVIRLMRRSKWFKKVDKDVQGFVFSATRLLLYLLVIVIAISIMGVPMASIIAVIASCGVAVGLALQGSLSNLAGGLMLIIFKPFHVGDYIVTNGYEGTVEEIGVFSTSLVTVDNRRIIIPNAAVWNSSIANATHYKTRRVDLIFKTGMDEDSSKVTGILTNMAKKHENRLKDMEPEARFDSFGEGCAKYHLRVWCKTEDYWELYYALLDEGKKALVENGVEISLPQMAVHNS